jgi:hypothetical protein
MLFQIVFFPQYPDQYIDLSLIVHRPCLVYTTLEVLLSMLWRLFSQFLKSAGADKFG